MLFLDIDLRENCKMDKFIRRETDNQSEDFTSDSEDATSGTINEAEQPSTSKKRKISSN